MSTRAGGAAVKALCLEARLWDEARNPGPAANAVTSRHPAFSFAAARIGALSSSVRGRIPARSASPPAMISCARAFGAASSGLALRYRDHPVTDRRRRFGGKIPFANPSSLSVGAEELRCNGPLADFGDGRAPLLPKNDRPARRQARAEWRSHRFRPLRRGKEKSGKAGGGKGKPVPSPYPLRPVEGCHSPSSSPTAFPPFRTKARPPPSRRRAAHPDGEDHFMGFVKSASRLS
jgi:hypothetical protein